MTRGAMIPQRVAVLILTTATLGLPINQKMDLALLALVLFSACVGSIHHCARRWLAALVVVAVAASTRLLLPAPEIQEGHNLFLPPPQGEILRQIMPPDVHDAMVQRFNERYPPAEWCPGRTCWTSARISQAFGFSADGLLQSPPTSRVVGSIDFTNLTTLRARFVNETIYGWYDRDSAVKRTDLPYFVVYRWPTDGLIGARLCFTGEILWETAPGSFAPLSSPTPICRTLTAEDAGHRVFGLGMTATPLSMRLELPFPGRLASWARTLSPILGVAGLLILLVRVRPSRAAGYALVGLAGLAVILVTDATLINGLRPLEGGNDGIGHSGQAGSILQNLAIGNIALALRGGEDVFYFMPGLRYMRAIEGMIFGDSAYLYLLCLLAVPFLILRVTRHLLPPGWAIPVLAVFLLTTLTHRFGGSYWDWVRQGSMGMPDPMGYAFFLAALALALARQEKEPPSPAAAVTIGAMLSLACWLRPNLLPGSGMIMAVLSLCALNNRAFGSVAALATGFSPILLMPLHNWFFGHRLVLFTSSIDIDANLITGPKVWAAAARDLITGHIGEPARRVAHQLREWSWGFDPLHMAIAAILVWTTCRRTTPLRTRLVALTALAQQGVLWIYDPRGFDLRYSWLAWLLSLLITLVWLRETGIPALAGRFPAMAAKTASASGVRRISRLWSPSLWAMLANRLDRLTTGGKGQADA